MAKWSVKTIPELRKRLQELAETGQNLSDAYQSDRGFYDDCVRLFGQLRRSFDPKKPDEMAEILRQVILAHPDYEDKELEELWPEETKPETKLSQKEIEELVTAYEKAIDEKERQKIEIKIKKGTGEKDVDQFIRRQRELRAEKEVKKEKEVEVKTTADKIEEIVAEETEAEEIDKQRIREKVEEIVGKNKEEVERLATKVEEIVAERKIGEERKDIARAMPEDTPDDKVETVTNKIREIASKDPGTGEIDRQGIRKGVQEVIGKDKKVKEAVEKLVLKAEEVAAQERVRGFASNLGEKVAKLISNNPEVQEKIKKVIEQRVNRVVITAEDGDINQVRPVNKVPMDLAEEIRKSVKVESETVGVGPVLEETKLEVDGFLKKNVEVVDRVRSGAMKERFERGIVKNLGGEEAITPEQRTAIENYKEMLDRVFFHRAEKPANIEPYRLEAEAAARNSGVEPSRVEQGWHELRATIGVLRTKPQEFNRMVELYKKGNKLIGNKLPNIPEIKAVEKIMQLAAENKTVLGMINFTQKFVAITDTFNGLGGKILVKLGADKLGWTLLEKVGGQAGVTFATEALKIVGKEGMEKGIMTILKGVLGGGVKAGTVAAEGGAAAGVGGGLAPLITAFQALPVVGQVILVAALAVAAAGVVWKTVIAPVLNGVKNFVQKNFNIDLNRVKSFIAEDLGMGKFVGGVGQFFFDVGLFLVGIPALLAAINFTRIIAPVFIFFMVGMLGYSLLQSSLVSSLVPPPPTGGGNCVLKKDTENGMINCDQAAPENSFPGINMDSYISLANRWKAGKNYSEECYNDTVNRALCGGINPAYALWAWVHESGASNYSTPNVEDFGIHGQASAPPKNYNAQITYFLKLDPGAKCLSDPRIGGNYWLGFATNYLNGSCDPDEKNKTNGMTGREYLAEMQTTWGWVSSEPMPANIQVAKGGQDCENIGKNSGGESTYEYTDENGNVWVCYGKGGVNIPDFDPWDPTIPVPEGCPNGLPASGYFTQGPFAPGCTHQNMQSPAIDIGAGNGTPIYATHPGIAEIGYSDMPGFYVILHGVCEGKSFTTHYYHMPEGGQRVSSNQEVKAGDLIGIVDNMGNSTGPHLHYQINGLDVNKFGQYLGLTIAQTEQLWGCCGKWNGKYCP